MLRKKIDIFNENQKVKNTGATNTIFQLSGIIARKKQRQMEVDLQLYHGGEYFGTLDSVIQKPRSYSVQCISANGQLYQIAFDVFYQRIFQSERYTLNKLLEENFILKQLFRKKILAKQKQNQNFSASQPLNQKVQKMKNEVNPEDYQYLQSCITKKFDNKDLSSKEQQNEEIISPRIKESPRLNHNYSVQTQKPQFQKQESFKGTYSNRGESYNSIQFNSSKSYMRRQQTKTLQSDNAQQAASMSPASKELKNVLYDVTKKPFSSHSGYIFKKNQSVHSIVNATSIYENYYKND